MCFDWLHYIILRNFKKVSKNLNFFFIFFHQHHSLIYQYYCNICAKSLVSLRHFLIKWDSLLTIVGVNDVVEHKVSVATI